jgi:membrane-bound ClpP family serine protease
MIDHTVLRAFCSARDQLSGDEPVALVIDSPGGLAEAAYQTSRLLQREGGFTVVIPRYAKSAATLLALGANTAMMDDDAEIGPLDAQVWDNEREQHESALDEVQALDQLTQAATAHLDHVMVTMLEGTNKRTDTLLPAATGFVSELMRPMLAKIDAVHYAKRARTLAVAEQYAIRLLIHRGTNATRAQRIAHELVHGYPEHAFVIDRSEADTKDYLPLDDPSPTRVARAVRDLQTALWEHPTTAIGRVIDA